MTSGPPTLTGPIKVSAHSPFMALMPVSQVLSCGIHKVTKSGCDLSFEMAKKENALKGCSLSLIPSANTSNCTLESMQNLNWDTALI